VCNDHQYDNHQYDNIILFLITIDALLVP